MGQSFPHKKSGAIARKLAQRLRAAALGNAAPVQYTVFTACPKVIPTLTFPQVTGVQPGHA